VLKFQIFAQASGTPISTVLSPRSLPPELQSYLPPKTISITVNSVPQGATLKVDSTEVGVTPKIIQVAPGKHMLEFSKDGFNKGHFPLEINIAPYPYKLMFLIGAVCGLRIGEVTA